MTITTPHEVPAAEQPLAPQRLVRDFRLWEPEWLRRWPEWLRVGLFLFILIAASVYFRSQLLNGQYWMDEAISVGIASHPLGQIPGVLRMDGSPPLYYFLLHFWIQIFGNGEAATHSLSLLFATLCIPVSYWSAHSLFGKRAALMTATLFALNPFLTQYAQETRMYTLMALLGLLATTGFIHGFVYRRRKYVALFAVSQALMLYTHAWGLFFGAGSLVALIIVYYLSDAQHRQNLIRDGVYAYVGAGVLFLPWLPNFFYQTIHTAAPWDSSPRFGAPVQLSRNLIGGDPIFAVLAVAAGIGLAEYFLRRGRRTDQGRVVWVLVAIPFVTLFLAWLASQITPAWSARYFAPLLAPVVLLACMGAARAGIVGAIALVLAVFFLGYNPGAAAPGFKSDVQDISAEIQPLLHPGDLVIVGQPEQTPLANFYFDRGLRWANTMQGLDRDPTFMDWVNALQRYQKANPWKILPPLLKSLKPGQQLVLINPFTEGVRNWIAPWTWTIRLRTAQWESIIHRDKSLKLEAWAPHNYHGAVDVGNYALLFKKV
jgi:4-amino-4-deoxy-L-arabinose transferase-like glycosyltransferase